MGSKQLYTYPQEEQLERWEREAQKRGYDGANSNFIKEMVEAGLKKFDADIEPDETNRELRQERNTLKDDLDDARERIAQLEDIAYHGDQKAIKRYIENNPGADFDAIVQHIINTAPERINRHLDELVGEEIKETDDGYYPAENGGS